jgi:protease IV
MRKFLLGVFVGVVFVALCVVVLVAVALKIGANKGPSIAKHSALVLNMEGDLPEVPPVDMDLPFLSTQSQPTVRDLWAALHSAASDDRIKALVLEPHGLSIGWGKLDEIRHDIQEFKKSGKPVYAYLRTPGMHEYYLASVADKIYVDPDDYLELRGFRIEAMYLKNTLDKLGISFDVDHIGRYKDAGDILTRTNMSSETREVMNSVLDQVYNSFCSTVGQSRHKSSDEMKALIDQGPFLASAAKSAGLVDTLGYEDQLLGDIRSKIGDGDLNKISYRNYIRAVPSSGTRIALLAGEGDIIRGSVEGPFGQQSVIASETFAKAIEQVRKDSSIRGVVLRVDSPGGDAVASDEILHDIQRLSKEKPLVISMSDVAASGGYFISMTGDPVLAYPNTLTGSIGVLYGKPNLHGLYDKIGINKELLTRGKFADIDSDYTSLSDAARQKLHHGIQSTYKSFVSKVAAARKRTYDQVEPLAQGRVWMGAQARGNGLVDDLGGLDRAVELVRERARLSPGTKVTLVAFPPRRSLLETLINSGPDALAEAAVTRKIRALTGDWPGPAFMRGGILELMPYRIQIR